MSVLDKESQRMKAIRKHLVDKSNCYLIAKDDANVSNNFTEAYLVCRLPIFPAISLLSRKFQSIVNTNPVKKLTPYFARWCAIPL